MPAIRKVDPPPTPDPRLAAVFEHAESLGDVGGWEYRATCVVFRRDTSGAIELYCERADWEQDPLAKAILFAQEIEMRRAELAALEGELQALLAAPEETQVPADVVDMPGFEVEAASVDDWNEQALIEATHAATNGTAPTDELRCSICGQSFPDRKRLGGHLWRSHKIHGTSSTAKWRQARAAER